VTFTNRRESINMKRLGVLAAVGVAALVVAANAAATDGTTFTASYTQNGRDYRCSGTHFVTTVSSKDVETCLVTGDTQGRVAGTYSGSPYGFFAGEGSNIVWISDFDGTSRATNWTTTVVDNGNGTFTDHTVAYYPAPPFLPFALYGSGSGLGVSVGVNAYSQPVGTTMGTFSLGFGSTTLVVRVQCAVQVGDQFWVGGVFDSTRQPWLAGHKAMLVVRDAGATGDTWNWVFDWYGIADGLDLAACPHIEEPSLPGSFVARPM
jgi:hypothetical protein